MLRQSHLPAQGRRHDLHGQMSGAYVRGGSLNVKAIVTASGRRTDTDISHPRPYRDVISLTATRLRLEVAFLRVDDQNYASTYAG